MRHSVPLWRNILPPHDTKTQNKATICLRTLCRPKYLRLYDSNMIAEIWHRVWEAETLKENALSWRYLTSDLSMQFRDLLSQRNVRRSPHLWLEKLPHAVRKQMHKTNVGGHPHDALTYQNCYYLYKRMMDLHRRRWQRDIEINL